jgi:hypothetical protein
MRSVLDMCVRSELALRIAEPTEKNAELLRVGGKPRALSTLS